VVKENKLHGKITFLFRRILNAYSTHSRIAFDRLNDISFRISGYNLKNVMEY
jgi:hypothetical protein